MLPADLGKKLLEAARLGQTENVQLLLLHGALFTTDWVHLKLINKLLLIVHCFCSLSRHCLSLFYM